jgi:hypothetical protein
MKIESRKTKHVLTLKQKKTIIGDIELKSSTQTELSKQYNVAKSTISRIYDKRKEILEKIRRNPKSQLKMNSKGRFGLIEDVLLEYIAVINSYTFRFQKI